MYAFRSCINGAIRFNPRATATILEEGADGQGEVFPRNYGQSGVIARIEAAVRAAK